MALGCESPGPSLRVRSPLPLGDAAAPEPRRAGPPAVGEDGELPPSRAAVVQDLRTALVSDLSAILASHHERLLEALREGRRPVPPRLPLDLAKNLSKDLEAAPASLKLSWSDAPPVEVALTARSEEGSTPRSGLEAARFIPVSEFNEELANNELTGVEDDLDKADAEQRARAAEVAQQMFHGPSQRIVKLRDRPLQKIVDGGSFEVFFGLAILTNAVFIAAQTNYAATNLTLQVPQDFQIIGAVYTIIFAVELIMRVGADGLAFFSCYGDTVHWNYLDVVIVASSIAEMIIDFVAPEGGGASNGFSQFRIMRILRVTRVIRIVRVTRIIRFIRALRTLINQIVFTIKSLVWAILLLILIIFLFGIVFTQTVSAHMIETRKAVSLDPGDPLMRFWGSLPRSMFTLYKAITGGISWDEVVDPLAETGWMPVGLFIAYISFAQLAVLNVLTGVFCQNAIDSANHDQELVAQAILQSKHQYVTRLEQIFRDMDADGSGMLTIQEFKDHLDDPKVHAIFESLELDTTDVWTLFKLMDSDTGHVLDLDEFVTGCMRLKGPAKGLDMAKLNYEQRFAQRRMAKHMKIVENALVNMGVASPTAGSSKEKAKMKIRFNSKGPGTGELEPGALGKGKSTASFHT